MAIQPGYKANFETLCKAFDNDDVCILECQRATNGETVVLICAVQRVEDEFEFVPFAEMVNGNPYEMYVPPMESAS